MNITILRDGNIGCIRAEIARLEDLLVDLRHVADGHVPPHKNVESAPILDQYGSYHHMGATWLDLYAGEMSWRENNRQAGNKQAMFKLLRQALVHPISRTLKGYWQHWLLPDDELERQEIRWQRVFQPLWKGEPTMGNCLAA